MGSGTTAVAAMSLGRHFVGMEAAPEYYDRAIQRIHGLKKPEIKKSATRKRKQKTVMANIMQYT